MQAKQEHQSIRLFENDLLERLSHVHPIVPLLLWAPLAAWLYWRSVALHGFGAVDIGLMLLAGLVVWTLAEYSLHRFVFHFKAKSKAGKWFVYLFHGNHHDDPKDKTRLVMPPAGAIPIMALLWGLFSLFVPHPWIEPFMASFIVGYLVYDYIHYSTHHFPMKNPVAKFLKHYHLKHHYAGETGRYGVSSPLWDWVFGSDPERGRAGTRA